MPEWILVKRLKQEVAARMERVRWYLQRGVELDQETTPTTVMACLPRGSRKSGHGFHLHPMLTAKLMAHGESKMQVPLRRPIVWPKTKASGDGGDGGSLGVGERQRGGGG